MNEALGRLLNALGAQLPALAALVPFGGLAGAGVKIIAAIGQQMLGNPLATAEQLQKHIEENPEAAKEALQPLEDHVKAVAAASVAVAAETPPAELPAATESLKDAVLFASDDREIVIGPADKNGRAIMSIYLTEEQTQAACAAE